MVSRAVFTLLLASILVTGSMGGVTADESYGITIENGEVSIPERTEPIAGYEFTVDSVAPISEGETLDVTTTAPAGEFYFANLYDSNQDRIIDKTLRGSNSTSFDTEALDLDPGTYAVAIVAGGPETIQPVVIEAYQMSLSASESVEQGENITADITLDGTDPEPASVDVIVANESINKTTTAQKVTDQTYEAEIPADYTPGEYRLYAVARETDSGSATEVQDILSMSDENTLEITESDASTSNGTESSTADETTSNTGGGGGGGAAPAPAATSQSESAAPTQEASATIEQVDDTAAVSFASGSPVERVQFSTPDVTGSVAVRTQEGVPEDLASPPGTPLYVSNISVPTEAADTPATMQLTVNKSRYNASSSTLAVTRLANGSWSRLETTVANETATTIQLTAETPGFSYFAVSDMAELTSSESTNQSVNESAATSENTTTESTTTESTTTSSTSGGESTDTNRSTTRDSTPGFGLLVAVLSLLVVASLARKRAHQ